MKKLARAGLRALRLAALGLAACGGGDDDDDPAAETTATHHRERRRRRHGQASRPTPTARSPTPQTEVSAPAGSDTIEFDNPASLGHDVVIEDSSGNEVARTDVITGDHDHDHRGPEAGTYTFFCSVDGHREAGMEGTLTVK